jgi:hypothetical protein
MTAAILLQDMPYFAAGESVVLPQCTNLRSDLQYSKNSQTKQQKRRNRLAI